MVKKDQELQVEIIYSRQDGIDQTYVIERRKDADGLSYADILAYRDQYMQEYKIYTQVTMSYLSDEEEILPINEDFFLSYQDLEVLFEGNFVILLKPQMDCLHSKIDEIQQKVGKLAEQIKKLQVVRDKIMEIENAGLRRNFSLQQGIKKHLSQKPQPNKQLDIGILFSEPLVQKKAETEAVRLLADPVKYREEIDRLKRSLERTNRIQISIKCCIATNQYLDSLLKQKVKILHLICHGSIEVVKIKGQEESLGVLQFQHLNNIGYMQKIYGSDIPGFIKPIPEKDRPKLVFVNACHSELIGDAFLSSGIPFVVVIQSSEKIEDNAAQEFSIKFYNSIFRGIGVKDSFQDAKGQLNRMNRPVNSNICCCFHPNAHQPKCLFKQKCEESGIEWVHEFYHVPACKCNKRHLNLHLNTCAWALETLFQINRAYRVESPTGVRRLTIQQLQDQPQLMICCCSTPSKMIPHDETEKFKFKWGKNVNPNEALFQASPITDLQAEVIDQTSAQLQGNFMHSQRLFGRNMNIFNLICEIKQSGKVVIVYGSEGSGKTKVTTRAVSYMVERGQFKDFFFYVDLSGITTSIDFNFKIIKKVKFLKLNNLTDVYSTLSNKDMVFILDNVDMFIKTSYAEFKWEISKMLDKLNNTKIVMILSEKTVKGLDVSIFNERRYFLEPLKKFAAADMFIMHAKEYLADINMKEVWSLFEDEALRSPKTILDMVHYIKSNFSNVFKIKVKQLCEYMKDIKSNQSENERFLQQNILELSKNNQAFNMFLFLCEFRDGLTEMDFMIMNSHPEEEFPKESILIPSNWKRIIFDLLYFDLKDRPSQIIQGNYYYCQVEVREESKKIRVKRYILEYMKQQNKFGNVDMKFKALAYLSNFSMSMIRILKEQNLYHQILLEYTNFSNAGIFQFDRYYKFREFFDEGDFFPDGENMTQSTKRNKKIDKEMKQLFQNNFLVSLHPSLSMSLHQANIMELYKTDYSGYYETLESEKKKLFKYYYLNLMLNIPTNVKTMDSNTTKEFLTFCIENSTMRVRSLDGNKQSKTKNLCLIKLLMMRVVVDLEKIQFPDQAVFRPYFDSINLLSNMWEKQSYLSKLIRMDQHFLSIGILYRLLQLSNKSQTYNQVLKVSRLFKMEYDSIDEENQMDSGALILMSKYHLMMAQCFYNAMDKMKLYKGFEQFKYTYDLVKKEVSLREAMQVFESHNLKLLQVRVMVKLVRVKMGILKKKGLNDDVDEYYKIKSDLVGKIRELLSNPNYKIVLRKSQKQLFQLEGKLNKKIWSKTKNFIVFMKACPIINTALQEGSLIFNTVRRTHNFKSIIESIFQNSILDDQHSRPQREVSIRFEILTLNRGLNIINQGCSLLVLTINVVIQEGKVYLQFEQEDIPIEHKVELGAFLKEANFKNITLIMICGQHAHMVGAKIRQLPQQTPMVITVGYKSEYYKMSMENYYEMGYFMFALKSLQRISIYHFIKAFIQKLVFSAKESRCEDIVQYYNAAKESTLVYMMGFSNETSDKQKLRKVFTVESHLPKEKPGQSMKLQFKCGSFHSVSSQRSSFHNLKPLEMTFIGRQKLLIQTMTQLVECKAQKKACYINVFGPRCSGKTSFICQLSDMLLERGHFKKGLYILEGSEIYKKYKGNIGQYLEDNKNQIFQITYLNERDITETSEMLIIIDDFNALRNKSNYLEYFFNSIFNKSVSLIITTSESLSTKSFQEFKDRSFQSIQLKTFGQQESSFLSYIFVPLYNFEQYMKKFTESFFTLKKKKNSFTPKFIIQEFKKILKEANSNDKLIRYPSYKYFVYNLVKNYKPLKNKNRSHQPQETTAMEQGLGRRRRSGTKHINSNKLMMGLKNALSKD